MPSYGRPAYWDFSAAGQSELLWDTIVLAFAASRDLEVEVCEPPDDFITEDGQPTVAFGLSGGAIRQALISSVKRQKLTDHVRVHITRKKGGHVWLQKIGAEIYADQLESEKLVPYWTKKPRKKRRKRADI